jgi:tetratricopeptide (TPR) repeat protein
MRKIFFTLALLSALLLNAQEDSVIVARSDTFTLDSIKSEVVEHSKAGADSAYIKGDYQQAIQIYEELLCNGEAAEVYYNLGNSYYKAGDIAKAILNYERALLLQPGNADVRANLELARAKTVDKVEPTPEIFFVAWGKALVNTMSSNQWAYVSIVAFILLMASIVAFVMAKSVALKKTGFFGGIVMLVVVILANLFASQQKSRLQNRNSAIVITPSVSVRSTPSESGTALFVLHEGHKVEINDSSMRSWKEIRLEDGKVGWVPDASIEVI